MYQKIAGLTDENKYDNDMKRNEHDLTFELYILHASRFVSQNISDDIYQLIWKFYTVKKDFELNTEPSFEFPKSFQLISKPRPSKISAHKPHVSAVYATLAYLFGVGMLISLCDLIFVEKRYHWLYLLLASIIALCLLGYYISGLASLLPKQYSRWMPLISANMNKYSDRINALCFCVIDDITISIRFTIQKPTEGEEDSEGGQYVDLNIENQNMLLSKDNNYPNKFDNILYYIESPLSLTFDTLQSKQNYKDTISTLVRRLHGANQCKKVGSFIITVSERKFSFTYDPIKAPMGFIIINDKPILTKVLRFFVILFAILGLPHIIKYILYLCSKTITINRNIWLSFNKNDHIKK